MNIIKRKALKHRAIIYLSLPALTLLFLFRFLPLLESARTSLYEYNLVAGTMKWHGIEGYLHAFRDPIFLLTLRNTVLFFFLQVPIQVALAFGLALLVKKQTKGVGVMRTIILIPSITSMVVVTTIWGLMYNSSQGLLSSLLRTVGLPPQPFLNSPQQALPCIVLMTIWKGVGFNMIFFLAGLMAIPPEYYEAARVDGANNWQITRYITLPLIKRTAVFVLLTQTIFSFRVFTPIFLMTRGGPLNATRVIVLYIYENAFKFNKMGYATTISVILAIILLTLSLIQLFASKEQEKVDGKRKYYASFKQKTEFEVFRD